MMSWMGFSSSSCWCCCCCCYYASVPTTVDFSLSLSLSCCLYLRLALSLLFELFGRKYDFEINFLVNANLWIQTHQHSGLWHGDITKLLLNIVEAFMLWTENVISRWWISNLMPSSRTFALCLCIHCSAASNTPDRKREYIDVHFPMCTIKIRCV